jgi:hypothetical protein
MKFQLPIKLFILFSSVLCTLTLNAEPSQIIKISATYKKFQKLFEQGRPTSILTGAGLYEGVCADRELYYSTDPDTGEKHTFNEAIFNSFLYVSSEKNVFFPVNTGFNLELGLTSHREKLRLLINKTGAHYTNAFLEDETLTVDYYGKKVQLRVSGKTVILFSPEMSCQFKSKMDNKLFEKIIYGIVNSETDIPNPPEKSKDEMSAIEIFLQNQDATQMLFFDHLVDRDPALLQAVDRTIRKSLLKKGIEVAKVNYTSETYLESDFDYTMSSVDFLLVRSEPFRDYWFLNFSYVNGQPLSPEFKEVMVNFLERKIIDAFDYKKALNNFVKKAFRDKRFIDYFILLNLENDNDLISAVHTRMKSAFPNEFEKLKKNKKVVISAFLGKVGMGYPGDLTVPFDNELKTLVKEKFITLKPWLNKAGSGP